MTLLPPRLLRLRDEIVASIPCRKPAHRQHLGQLPFPAIMNVYVNYVGRLIIPRPRRVVFAPNFWDINDARQDEPVIHAMADEIAAGTDLTPRLSSLVRFCGYRPDRYDDDGHFIGNKWWSRDFALNVYGLHHLHLDAVTDPKAPRNRSSRVVFVEFTRDVAVFVMVGDHDFDSTQLEERVLRLRAGNDQFVLKGVSCIQSSGYSAEQRIQAARAGLATYAVVDGKVVMSSTLATDGTSESTLWHRSRILKSLFHYDPLFDDHKWVAEQFRHAGHTLPSAPEFLWLLQGTNLLMLETVTDVGITIFEGRQGYVKLAA